MAMLHDPVATEGRPELVATLAAAQGICSSDLTSVPPREFQSPSAQNVLSPRLLITLQSFPFPFSHDESIASPQRYYFLSLLGLHTCSPLAKA